MMLVVTQWAKEVFDMKDCGAQLFFALCMAILALPFVWAVTPQNPNCLNSTLIGQVIDNIKYADEDELSKNMRERLRSSEPCVYNGVAWFQARFLD